MIPFEYVDRRGERIVSDWKLQAPQKTQIKVLLRSLKNYDLEMAAGTIFHPIGAGKSGIHYAKINGTVALRPRLCIGPGNDNEITFLERVTKKGGVESPLARETRALDRLEEIRIHGSQRRKGVTLHEERT